MDGVTIRQANEPGDLGWMVMAHGQLYAEQFGWDREFESLVCRIVADFAEASGKPGYAAWVAELDGLRVGCVMCVPGDSSSQAKLRILLVAPEARGHGVGTGLTHECIEFARSGGCEELTLWTNDVLASARRIYQAAGFTMRDQSAHHSFGKDLVGQNWTLRLR